MIGKKKKKKKKKKIIIIVIIMHAAVWGTNGYVGDLHLTSLEFLASHSHSHIMTFKNIFCYHGYHKNIFNVILILILSCRGKQWERNWLPQKQKYVTPALTNFCYHH